MRGISGTNLKEVSTHNYLKEQNKQRFFLSFFKSDTECVQNRIEKGKNMKQIPK